MGCRKFAHFCPEFPFDMKKEEAYGEVSTLVHLVRPLLASGTSGSGPISNCLVASAAFPDRRHSSGRRAFPDMVNYYAAGQDPSQNLSSEF